MAEEHDSWLQGIGVKVENLVESVVDVVDGDDAEAAPATTPDASHELCAESEDASDGQSLALQATTSDAGPDASSTPPGPAQPKMIPAVPAPKAAAPAAVGAAGAAPTNRPAKPSNPDAQMRALLAAAKARAGNSTPSGACYKAFKLNVKDAGGYGDILDIYSDERFKGFQMSAVKFADAVKANGAANLGLEEVSGSDPLSATPGTVLVLRGNGKSNISVADGDISVVDKIEGGILYCYNDGKMPLDTRAKTWASDGLYGGMMVAMYRPIARA